MSDIGQLSTGAIVNRRPRFNFFGAQGPVVLLVLGFKKHVRRQCQGQLLAAVLAGLAMAPQTAAADLSFAEKMAVVDEGRFVPTDSLAVPRARAALTAASKTCGGAPENRIGDAAVSVSNALQRDGIYSRPVDILEGLTAIAHEGVDGLETCAELLGAYAAARKEQTHSSAVAGLRDVFRTVYLPQRATASMR